MTNPVPPPLVRAKIRVVHLGLVVGLCAMSAVVSFLFWNGTAPLLPTGETGLIAGVLAVGSLGSVLLGWFWFKPRIPRRARNQSTDDFWRPPEPGGNALLFWILCEGGSMIGLVGMLLTGSAIPAVGGALGLVVLLTNGPTHLEERQV